LVAAGRAAVQTKDGNTLVLARGIYRGGCWPSRRGIC
jgi:hypothetical protein